MNNRVTQFKFFTFLALLVLSFFVINSCNEDEAISTTNNNELLIPKNHTQKRVSISEVPEISQILTEEIQPFIAQKSNNSIYNSINTDEIIEVINELGVSSYTFSLNLEETETLTNLVISRKSDSEFEVYLIKYIPDDFSLFIEPIIGKTTSMPLYNGNIQKLDLEGNILDDAQFIDGQKQTTQLKSMLCDEVIDAGYECNCEPHHGLGEDCRCTSGGSFYVVTLKKPCGPAMDGSYGGGGGGGSGSSSTTPNINYKAILNLHAPADMQLIRFNLPQAYRLMDAFGRFLHEEGATETNLEFISWAVQWLMNHPNKHEFLNSFFISTYQPLDRAIIEELMVEYKEEIYSENMPFEIELDELFDTEEDDDCTKKSQRKIIIRIR